MATLEEEQDALREALRDLAYSLVKPLGIIWLVRRLGMTPVGWIREREIRDLHRRLGPEVVRKIDKVNEDLAASPYGALTLDEAVERLERGH